jgi:hypothetical protein
MKGREAYRRTWPCHYRLSQIFRALENVVLRTASVEKSGLSAIARVPKKLGQGSGFIENTTR